METISLSRCLDIKTSALLILVTVFLLSCGNSSKYVARQYSLKYENKPTNIDSLINIDGYFTIPHVYVIANKNDIDYSQMIFFKNGLFADGIFLEDLLNTSNTFLPYSSYWGTYIICGDTIKTQEVHYDSTMGYYGWDVWYKVIDRNTIKEIYRENLGGYYSNASNKYVHELYKKERVILPIKFVPLQYIPSPERAWILQHKWFWKNEDDWVKYMESIGKKVKKK